MTRVVVDIPKRCPSCGRYCDGTCPLAKQLALIDAYAQPPRAVPVRVLP